MSQSPNPPGPQELPARLTLLDLLLLPVGGPALRFPILALAAGGLLIPPLLRRRALFAALFALTGLRVALDWPLPDNHAYLLCYWCLALAIARGSPDGERVLATNARWLVVAVFGLATLWKAALSPDFADGTFFRVTLLTDPRFEDLTRLAGGLSSEQIHAARAVLERHVDGPGLAGSVAAGLPARFDLLARALTAWTLAIEAAIAVAFAWPRGRGPSRLRDALLIAFCATTYAVAPVEGFGWLLVAMGLAQCGEDRPRTRIAYLATFALILFYREVAWLGWLARISHRGA